MGELELDGKIYRVAGSKDNTVAVLMRYGKKCSVYRKNSSLNTRNDMLQR
jgi:hypothetical protein